MLFDYFLRIQRRILGKVCAFSLVFLYHLEIFVHKQKLVDIEIHPDVPVLQEVLLHLENRFFQFPE
jgi:hypothetical protein